VELFNICGEDDYESKELEDTKSLLKITQEDKEVLIQKIAKAKAENKQLKEIV